MKKKVFLFVGLWMRGGGGGGVGKVRMLRKMSMTSTSRVNQQLIVSTYKFIELIDRLIDVKYPTGRCMCKRWYDDSVVAQVEPWTHCQSTFHPPSSRQSTLHTPSSRPPTSTQTPFTTRPLYGMKIIFLMRIFLGQRI